MAKERKYDQKTLGLLWGKSGGICAFPDCENELVINNIDELVGHICHIVGLKGPRADVEYPKSKIDKYENLILLCRHHHGIVDIDTSNHTVDELIQIKTNHENEIKKRLSTGTPWNLNISQIYYLNIPRLSILSEFQGYPIDFSFLGDYRDLHSIGFELSRILLQFKSLFTKIKPNIVDADSISKIDNSILGLTFSFNGTFRTKNIVDLDLYENGKFNLKGDINKDPQIYKKLKAFKIILTIDPKWITTTTSFVNFRPSGGIGQFAGIATFKHIDRANNIVLATPLIIGVPISPYDNIFKKH
jgi:hypothetical protein